MQISGKTGSEACLASFLSSLLFLLAIFKILHIRTPTSSSRFAGCLLSDLGRKEYVFPTVTQKYGVALVGLVQMPTMTVLITVVKEKDASDGRSSSCVHLTYIDREWRGSILQGKFKCSDRKNEGWVAGKTNRCPQLLSSPDSAGSLLPLFLRPLG